nr:GGDEF domain-containing phosphodiesterase [uncultured Neokomagataea sp.]
MPARHLLHCLERQLPFRELDIALVLPNRKVWCQLTGRPVYQNGIFRGYRGVGLDITRERAARIAHGQRARFDRETGLPNRLAVIEHLQGLLQERASAAGELVVCIISLEATMEGQAAVTDIEEGVVLREAAIRLMRESGSLYVGRYAKGRLAVVTARRPLSGCFDRVSVEAFIQRLHEALGGRVALEDGRQVTLDPYIGSVLSMVENQRADLFLEAAEMALQDALSGDGERCSLVDQVVVYGGERQSRLMDDIRRAVDQHEFQLVYQPIIHAQTGCIVGYEALSRWSGAVHGAVSIQKVIALIEENGQSDTFDYWVLETACKQAVSWPEGTWVAVNMAAMHFSVPGVAERILDIVHHAGVDPSRLQIEVTETFALDVGPQVAHALALLDEAGIKLAMDDFGAGYSSMNYLRLYPFSKIKLDASLVQDVLYNPKSKGILRSAVELSVDLGLSLTAEGVSSPEHYRFLREAGCTDLQGFYLGRPVPAEHLVWGHVMGQEYFG